MKTDTALDALSARPGLVPALRRALARAPGPGSGWSVCLKQADGQPLAVFMLENTEQVGHFAVELEQHGFEVAVEDDHPCDYVFRELDAQPVP